MNNLYLLHPADVLAQWPTIKPHIDSALAHSVGEITTFQLFKKAMLGEVHVWVYLDEHTQITAVLSTRFLHFENRKSLQIMTCGGAVEDWDIWLDHNHVFENFCKNNGCSSIQIWGRKGWGRKLAKVTSETGKSYRPLYHVFDMEIENDTD